MKQKQLTALVAITLAGAGACMALVELAKSGAWPNTWPEELEAYRKQARTFGVAHGIHEDVHEIPFNTRDAFELAWPHILKLKSKGAPLILERSPSSYGASGSTATSGVRILCPSYGLSVSPADGPRLHVGPPWPEYLMSEAGELPEYVENRDGKWKPTHKGVRARTDIVLITDGKIVDLNRIRLPADTPIVDNRFKEGHNQSDAGDSQ